MKYSYFLLSLLFLASCNSNPDMADVSKLEGFWEIQKAETPYEDKSYAMNLTIDYIHIEDSIGFRKKMQPSLLGNYQTSKDREYFSIENRKDKILLVYKTEYDTWTETLIRIEKDEFTIKNEQDFIYTYKRHIPQKLDLDEE